MKKIRKKISQDNFEVIQNKDFSLKVSKKEMDFYKNSHYYSAKQIFNFSKDQLYTNYFSEADLIMETFNKEGFTKYLGCLNFHGVLTRWKLFIKFLNEKKDVIKDEDCADVFELFANFLGRVTSYRALALTKDQFETVKKIDTILSTGRLKLKNEEIKKLIIKRGVKTICYNRLYMMERIDPSLSLHDDSETAVCIASNFLGPNKKVYLFELDVPLIETIGLVVRDVQSNEKEWFEYHGIWFDATKTTTERYMLNEIPLGKRLKSVKFFEGKEETNKYIEGFKKSQRKKKNEYDQKKLKK